MLINKITTSPLDLKKTECITRHYPSLTHRNCLKKDKAVNITLCERKNWFWLSGLDQFFNSHNVLFSVNTLSHDTLKSTYYIQRTSHTTPSSLHMIYRGHFRRYPLVYLFYTEKNLTRDAWVSQDSPLYCWMYRNSIGKSYSVNVFK